MLNSTNERWASLSLQLLALGAFAAITIALLSAGTASAVGGAHIAETTELTARVVQTQDLGDGYTQLETVLSAQFTRTDGTIGSYATPLTIAYPQASSQCSDIAVLDVVNSVFYETFDFAGTPGDPFFPSLLPLARMIAGDAFIHESGFVYGGVVWDKSVLERRREAGTLPDPSLHIERGTDGYTALRDASRVLRSPSSFLTGELAPVAVCDSSDVIGFGSSQTAMLLRGFYFAGLNTSLASSGDFDDALVFEGSIQWTPGSHCRQLTDDASWYTYSFKGCGGETPASQGRVVTVNSEFDVQILQGWKARPKNDSASHYRVYEIAGTSHIPTPLFPLKLLSIRLVSAADQNYADTAPVLRATLRHLVGWLQIDSAPPKNTFVKGRLVRLASPLFSSSSWGTDGRQVFIPKLGSDGNILGGVRLPHLRTEVSDGVAVGAPLGFYRGTECANDPTDSYFILDCGLSGDGFIYNIAGGTFAPYSEIAPQQCAALYPNASAYETATRGGAEFAAAEGWVLADEVEAIVQQAVSSSSDYPGCVPE